MLLSLIGEKYRSAHQGVRLAFAYRKVPQIVTTLRKLSRYKYGVASKQQSLGNAPDFIETACGLEFICWIDSSQEENHLNLEQRVKEAILNPDEISRYGILNLGLSDDLVNEISLIEEVGGEWNKLISRSGEIKPIKFLSNDSLKFHKLIPNPSGAIELPIWVDHVGGQGTVWQRFNLEDIAYFLTIQPGDEWWPWLTIKSNSIK